MEIITQWRAS